MSKRGDNAIIGVLALAAGTAVDWAIDQYEDKDGKKAPAMLKKVASGLTGVAVWYGLSEDDKRK